MEVINEMLSPSHSILAEVAVMARANEEVITSCLFIVRSEAMAVSRCFSRSCDELCRELPCCRVSPCPERFRGSQLWYCSGDVRSSRHHRRRARQNRRGPQFKCPPFRSAQQGIRFFSQHHSDIPFRCT